MRMIYKNFEEHITRKHGITIEGWPLSTFDNPSAIGSQMELKVLLNAWRTGATRFRRMNVDEHMAWLEARIDFEPPPIPLTVPPPATSPLPSQGNSPDLTQATGPPPSSSDPGHTLAVNPPPSHPSFVYFEPPATTSGSTNSTPRASRKPRKTQSDKGRPRKKASQIPGAGVFSASAL